MGLLDSVPLDQIYFILAQLSALSCALLYRFYDPDPDRSDSSSRSRTNKFLFLIIPGLVLAFICYGSQIFHILLLALLSYLLLLYVSPQWVHLVTLFVAIVHQSYLHVDRLVNDYSVYTVDITVPVMVLVQKVTTVAFGIHDGKYRAKKTDAKFTEEQKFHSLTRVPTVFEYAAYILNFQTVVCGPLVYYADWVEFVDGGKLRKAGLKRYPSAKFAVLSKLAATTVCGILIVTVTPMYPVSLLKAQAFVESTFLSKLMLMYWIALAARLKYYFAWTLSEAVSNASGLGFNGMDEKTGQPKWDLMNNIDIFTFENALSQRDALENWNKTTQVWLRRTVYERAPSQYKLLLTYVVSAIWHGFHPGYYLTFLTGAIFTAAARTGRRCLRYRFQQRSQTMFTFYHLLTWITSRIAIAYLVFPFILLEFVSAVRVYKELMVFGHCIAAAMIFGLPLVFKPEGRPSGKPGKEGKVDGELTPKKIPLYRNYHQREGPPRIQESVSEKMSKYGAT